MYEAERMKASKHGLVYVKIHQAHYISKQPEQKRKKRSSVNSHLWSDANLRFKPS